MNSNAFLISIKPQFAELIFSGKKTVELRRVPPRVLPGEKSLVYVSSPAMELQGCFEVARMDVAAPSVLWESCGAQSGICRRAFMEYFRGKALAHAIVIARSWRWSSSVCLSSLRRRKAGFRPPQNFHYLSPGEVALYAERRPA